MLSRKNRVTQRQTVPGYISFLPVSSLQVWAKCVVIRLDTRISQRRWKCSFCSWHLPSDGLCPIKMTSDIAWGERLSPLCTHSISSCDHMLSEWRGFMKRKRHELAFWVHVFVRLWLHRHMPNKHANTPETSEKGSRFRVNVSNMAYLAISLPLCGSSDVKEDSPLSWTLGSSLCQRETNQIIKKCSEKMNKKGTNSL